MNTAAHSDHCPTAHGDWMAVQFRLSWPQQLAMWLMNVQSYCWAWRYTSRA